MQGMAHELGIIGAGNMAEAIARGVIGAGVFRAADLIASDVSSERRQLFEKVLGVRAVSDNADAAREAKRVLLSVKPQMMGSVLAGLGTMLTEETLIISIAAGISSGYIERGLGNAKRWRVVRTMPNTPMLVGEGMVAIAPGAQATAGDLADVRRIFESAGSVVEVAEEKIDAVTAVSGSGPAYFFYLVEQMIRAGIELGLPPDQAHELATRTAKGAAKMLVSTSDSPQELRRKVTSPGGTTQAAITHLESSGAGAAMIEAVRAAHRRSRELGT